MNKNLFHSLALGAALSIASIGAASAAVINFSMNSMNMPTPTNVSLGGVYAFAGGLTAYAGNAQSFTATCTDAAPTPCLDYKYTNGDPTETGLGLIPTASNEINYPYGIAFKTASGYIGGLQLSSVQNGESWQVLGCADLNSSSSCSVIASGIGGNSSDTVTLSGFGNYSAYVVDIPCMNNISNCNPGNLPGATPDPGSTYGGNNVLVMSVTTVPEPGTLALFAAGLLGCMMFLRRRARQH
jgi:hypothetical protein